MVVRHFFVPYFYLRCAVNAVKYVFLRVHTKNEYGELKSVILGRTDRANWPKDDIFFNRLDSLSTCPKKIKRGPVDQKVIAEASDDLFAMKDLLENHGVKIF